MEEDKDTLLDKVKDYFSKTEASVFYNAFISPLEIDTYSDNKIVLIAPSKAQRDLLIQQHFGKLTNAFSTFTNKICEISIVSQDELDHMNSLKNKPIPKINSNLKPEYTFETLVIGENNNIAAATGLAVARSEKILYNPIFIYGGPGLGKTHLMHAIGNKILEEYPSKRILYVTSEEFLNDLVSSIINKTQDTTDFRNKYRTIDVLLMDDVQFLSKKPSSQEELYNTFNVLQQANKLIVFSADKPPKDIPDIEERLKSRFNWGVSVDISKPNFETRLAILKQKATEKNLIVDYSILSLIAEKIDTNIRDLEGALNKIIVFSQFSKQPITIEVAEKTINELITQQKKTLTADFIIETVAKYFNVNKKDLLSTKRSKEIIFPRQIAMYLCRSELNIPYQKISISFKKKDHTTIIHAENKIQEEINEGTNTKTIVDSIKNILKSLER